MVRAANIFFYVKRVDQVYNAMRGKMYPPLLPPRAPRSPRDLEGTFAGEAHHARMGRVNSPDRRGVRSAFPGRVAETRTLN
jgi:hypothetical protein